MYYENDTQISKLSNENRKINVTYDYKEVDTVTLTTIKFWNTGRRAIRREDIPVDEPLQFRFEDDGNSVQILDFNILKTAPGTGDFKIDYAEDYSGLILNFDYIDTDGGVVVEVQHTGGEHTAMEMTGRILGPKTPFKINSYHTGDFIMSWGIKRYGRVRFMLHIIMISSVCFGLISGIMEIEVNSIDLFNSMADNIVVTTNDLSGDIPKQKEAIVEILESEIKLKVGNTSLGDWLEIASILIMAPILIWILLNVFQLSDKAPKSLRVDTIDQSNP